MSAVRVLQVLSVVRALRVMSWVVAMLMWVLQVVCRLVAPLVLSRHQPHRRPAHHLKHPCQQHQLVSTPTAPPP